MTKRTKPLPVREVLFNGFKYMDFYLILSNKTKH